MMKRAAVAMTRAAERRRAAVMRGRRRAVRTRRGVSCQAQKAKLGAMVAAAGTHTHAYTKSMYITNVLTHASTHTYTHKYTQTHTSAHTHTHYHIHTSTLSHAHMYHVQTHHTCTCVCSGSSSSEEEEESSSSDEEDEEVDKSKKGEQLSSEAGRQGAWQNKVLLGIVIPSTHLNATKVENASIVLCLTKSLFLNLQVKIHIFYIHVVSCQATWGCGAIKGAREAFACLLS